MNVSAATVPTDLDEYRTGLRAWFAEHRAEFPTTRPASFEEHIARGLELSNALWHAGWKRVGWPESVGGTLDSARHRATYYDELCRAGLDLPNSDSSIEVMGPAMIEYAPALAERMLPRFLAGEELWAQGFSEPDAGSDLAALRTRAVADGDVFVVDGQKVWTSHGHLAQRIWTLVRTGTPESRHRGLAALLVDTDLDGVRVPADRLIGAPDQGWAVAMFMLQYERSMYAGQRASWAELRLRQLAAELEAAGAGAASAGAVHAAWLQLQAVRARAIESVRRLDAGEGIGPEATAGKVLLSWAEQAVFDITRQAAGAAFAFDDWAEPWRSEWWYSRASSIMGGAGEIQRSIIADRVLQLPREGA
jgi:alkylation response protein AidB-like acyl-CoA dehydrogenase